MNDVTRDGACSAGDLIQKVAVVTGANRGIGFEAARLLARRGIRVVLTARDAEAGGSAAARLMSGGLSVHFEKLDVTVAEDRDRLRSSLESRFGRLDILVNNAATASADDGDVLTVPDSALGQTLATNCLSALALVQTLLPLLRGAAKARIVNVTSGMGALSSLRGNLAAYRLSKTCLNAVTLMLAASLRDTNVVVAAVCPGSTRTRMGGANGQRSPEQAAAALVWAALDADDSIHGKFLRDGAELAW